MEGRLAGRARKAGGRRLRAPNGHDACISRLEFRATATPMRISPHPRCAYIPPLSFTVADVPLAQKDKDVTCRYYAVHAGVLDRLTDDPQPTCVNHVSCGSMLLKKEFEIDGES